MVGALDCIASLSNLGLNALRKLKRATIESGGTSSTSLDSNVSEAPSSERLSREGDMSDDDQALELALDAVACPRRSPVPQGSADSHRSPVRRRDTKRRYLEPERRELEAPEGADDEYRVDWTAGDETGDCPWKDRLFSIARAPSL